MNFYDKKTGAVFTETVLKMRGFPTENLEVMRLSNLYPIRYNYVSYDPMTQEQVTDGQMTFNQQEQVYIQNFKAISLSEGTLANNLSKMKKEAVKKINSEVSESILQGFDALVNGETLHFSFDSYDQGNFTDMVVTTISDKLTSPATITWNGYRGWTPENKGELVVLNLSTEEFQSLYDVAQEHKNDRISDGTIKKEAVNSAATIQDLRNLLFGFGISEDDLKKYADTAV